MNPPAGPAGAPTARACGGELALVPPADQAEAVEAVVAAAFGGAARLLGIDSQFLHVQKCPAPGIGIGQLRPAVISGWRRNMSPFFTPMSANVWPSSSCLPLALWWNL